MKLQNLINEVDTKDLLRAYNSNKDYIVLDVHAMNIGVGIRVINTNNYVKYENISQDGYSCILANSYTNNDIIKEELLLRLKKITSSWSKVCYNTTWELHLKAFKVSQYNYDRLRNL